MRLRGNSHKRNDSEQRAPIARTVLASSSLKAGIQQCQPECYSQLVSSVTLLDFRGFNERMTPSEWRDARATLLRHYPRLFNRFAPAVIFTQLKFCQLFW